MVKIKATAVMPAAAAASATVTVTPPPITVSVTPTPATVPVGTTVQFTATVANDPANRGVTWAVDCGYSAMRHDFACGDGKRHSRHLHGSYHATYR